MNSTIQNVPSNVRTDTKPSIFMSYSRKNADFVDRLILRLEGLGFDCWVDRQDLEAGATWREEISDSIRGCQAFVLVVSPDSTNSPIVSQELSLAEFHGRPIIPLIYEVCDLPPGMDLQIQHLHWVNFAVEHFDDAIVQLETALPALTDTPQKGKARSQRRLKSWVPWVGGFYFLSGMYHLVALLLFLGGWHALFNSGQLDYLEHLSGLERALWASIGFLHVAGAVCLLRLRRPVVGLFLADWCVYTVYVIRALVVIDPEASFTPILVSYGIFSLVVWYVWQLQKANLLSSPQVFRVGNGKETAAPGETGVSPLANPRNSEDIPTAIGKLT